jgi:hypothetical protein
MRLEILVDSRPALTARMAVQRYAEKYGLAERAARSAVARSGVPPIDPPPLHARIPLYDQAALDEAMANRPGKGANLRRPGPGAA